MPIINYKPLPTIQQRLHKLRSQKADAERAAAILASLHAIKKAQINVPTIAATLAGSIRRDTDSEGDASNATCALNCIV